MFKRPQLISTRKLADRWLLDSISETERVAARIGLLHYWDGFYPTDNFLLDNVLEREALFAFRAALPAIRKGLKK